VLLSDMQIISEPN